MYLESNSPIIMWNNISLSEALSLKCDQAFQASSVVIDSRNVKSGCIFIAITGEKNDGHDYINQAIASGASFCIVERDNIVPQTFPHLVVKSSLKALEMMGSYARNRINGHVIGITGSVGKTTVKEMLRSAFSPHGETYATHGNLNNHYGMPLTLANMPPSTEFAIIEMGMSSSGEISLLTKLAKPDIAIITNVELVHAEYFDGITGIALAKSEIMEGLPNNGTIVLNKDNSQYNILLERANRLDLKVVTYGFDSSADFSIEGYKTDLANTLVDVKTPTGDIRYSLKLNGKHMVLNSLAALSVVSSLGYDANASARMLRNFQPVHGRGFIHDLAGHGIIVIDESYNASPASTIAALKAVGERKSDKNRFVFALGDMKELGDESLNLHLSLVEHIIDNKVDILYTVGKESKNLLEHLQKVANISGEAFSDSLGLAEILPSDLRAGDIILIKGSALMNMRRVLDSVLHKFLV